ncbi:bifunctional folylpolyglutamate synthase/dihydrofolate synthase [Oscillatoria acuminata]|uniref:tetrahydrofolate synthase n=1 Tax=Oscillatoria acuminata PCC 6304 TaxID=56110 RepID=K9THR3_9CYAN|nr:folylpolyglutamate synthase/dihydrofolate synthase family protein [Oscillatoria acuminata]AFY81933.1 folylpolyglutamate synthase/dihydrofolate synthase [Oscillatoria acuminata PCC 6304]
MALATVDSLLSSFGRFGVELGLDRITKLLNDLGNPHNSVPLIHVAGTNGKGSVCAYLSTILMEAGYRVGRYTSPHLVDWTERICVNDSPISEQGLQQVLIQVIEAIDPSAPSPTQFEVITAAAWLYFAQQQLDVVVMEVGLGGRLDATNVCDRPLVTVITSISWEHWQRLGPTVADIAREKAGILKPGCPAVVGPLPPDAKTVVDRRIAELNCPAQFPEPATPIAMQPGWVQTQGFSYPLPLPGEAQLINSALAIATVQTLRQQGWQISDEAIAQGMAKTQWPGRLQWVIRDHRPLLIDGAHNAAAAQILGDYVASLKAPEPRPNLPEGASRPRVTWVMGMLSTKDHAGIFSALLRSGDNLYLVPVPDHDSAKPEDLATLARNICPELEDIRCYSDLFLALKDALQLESNLTVLCGSLYLLGYFFADTVTQKG